ncbi:MAG: hypothetical protein ACR2P8_13155, partial [Myxococcota bacterium]
MAQNARTAATSVFLLLWFVLLTAAGDAQGTERDPDPQPVSPVDTTSPRATLRSFLVNANRAAELERGGQVFVDHSNVPFRRALSTLDLSATPDSNSWVVRAERAALLHEVLGRLELPPESEIPGAREVADGKITRWTLPGTRIAFERVPAGPRRGEFLFSADTVERIERVYRLVKEQPYSPGATPGVYEEHVRPERAALLDSRLRERLEPVETSSPRAVYEGFVESVNRAHALVMQADSALRATPPGMTTEEAREAEQQARELLRRAEATLDLSQVPEA